MQERAVAVGRGRRMAQGLPGGRNRGGYVLHRQRGGGCQPVHVLPLFGVQSGVGH